ncbi:hypothetical protein JT31_01930 [Cedecea neteri]|uniref:Uncharacterized protein n=1 Tax=Cedecea neteri TaxID=158822 RepID=A0A089PWY3_9ENTR|nr:hypothetical protein JT31_01930 [Cedecea neteri]
MMIAQSLRLNPASLSANIHAPAFVVSAYAFAETPHPARVVPVPYESLLYIVLILAIASPPLVGRCCVKGIKKATRKWPYK